MFEFRPLRLIGISCLLAPMIACAASANVETDLPSVKIGRGDLVPTSTQHYGSSITHSVVVSDAVSPEIKALARGLKYDPDLIYGYVRNTIEITPLFGLQKGALGTYIDGHGTAFDQAQLLFELAKASVSQTGSVITDPKLVIGTITVTGDEFEDWFGITDVNAAKNLLAYGGIPADVSGSSTVTSVTMMHAWVKYKVDGTEYQFDPSFKAHKNYQPMDIDAITGFDAGSFRSSVAGTPGTTSELPHVEGLSTGAIATRLESYSSAILTELQKTENLTKTLTEIIGGSEILTDVIPAGGRRESSLSGHTSIGAFSSLGAFPDQFRTTLRVAFDGGTTDSQGDPVDVVLFADEIYGRKLEIIPDMQACNFKGTGLVADCVFNASLAVDGHALTPEGVSRGSDIYTHTDTTNAPNRVSWPLTLEVNHPYAAEGGAYMDQLLSMDIGMVTTASIVHGWGYTSGELMEKWAREYGKDTDLPVLGTCIICGSSSEPAVGVSAQENTKAKMGASWLAQYSRMADMMTRLQGGRALHHHTVGVSYSETALGEDTNGDKGKWWPGDQVLRLNLSSAISAVSGTGSQSEEEAMVHAITAAGSALEGAVFEQMIDSVDTASTAERFDWAQRMLGGTSTDADTGVTYQGTGKFLHMQPGDVGLAETVILQEGYDRDAADRPLHIFYYGQSAGVRQIENYLNQGYEIYTVNDEFVGPGYHLGEPILLGGQVTGDEKIWVYQGTKQRGAAFIAVKTDSITGEITDIAHVVTSRDGAFKGGAAANGADNQNQFDPAKAADILKDEFEDKSVVHGVDLASGNVSWSSGAILSVGNGGFPYELSLDMKVVNNQEEPEWYQPKHWRYDGMDDNLRAEAVVSGSGLEAMGSSHAWNAIGSLAAFYTAVEIAEGNTLKDLVTLPLINKWWKDTLRYNVVTLTGSAGGTQFFRFPVDVDDNDEYDDFNAPAGSAAELTQTGDRYIGERRLLDGGTPGKSAYRRWMYDQVSFELRLADGTKLTFEPQAHRTSNNEQLYRAEATHKHFLTRWRNSSGFNVQYEYDQGDDKPGVLLTRVYNDFGRELNINYSGSSAVPVSIDNGLSGADAQAVIFGGAATITTADGSQYRLEQATLPSDARVRPGFQLGAIYLPGDTSYPSLQYEYDEEIRIKSVKDAEAVRGNRNAYEFFIAPGYRGERQDPLGNSYAAQYGLAAHREDLSGGVSGDETLVRYGLFVDEVGRTVRTEHDDWGRVAARQYPEGNRQEFDHDAYSNVVEVRKVSKDGSETLTASAEYGYGDFDKVPTKVFDFVAHANGLTGNSEVSTELFYNDTTGLVTSAKRPQDLDGIRPEFTFQYNAYGQLERTTQKVSGTETMVTVMTYDGANGNLLTTTVDSTGLALTTTYGYDAVGNQTSVNGPQGLIDGVEDITTTVYDAMRRPTRVTDPFGTYSVTSYDERGRQIFVKAYDASGSFLQGGYQTYTHTGQVDKVYSAECFASDGGFSASRSACAVTDTDYTDLDQPEFVTDAEGRITKTDYFEDGKVNRIYKAWGTELEITYQQYRYAPAGGEAADYNGQPHWVQDANNNRTEYLYDGFGRLESTLFPDTVIRTTTNSLDREEYEYNANGQMLRKRTRRGDWIVHAYDYLNRMVWKEARIGDKNGPAQNRVNYSYDLLGRDKVIEQVGGTVTVVGYGAVTIPAWTLGYQYDTAGRLISETQNGRTVLFGHDAAGNRTSITYPGSDAGAATNVGPKTVAFTYDALGRMKTVTDSTASQVLATYAYDDLNRRTSLTHMGGTNNLGVAVTSATFHADSALATLAHDVPEPAVGDSMDVAFSFAYNRVNQVTTSNSSNAAYDYVAFDPLNEQLTPIETIYTSNGLNQYETVGGVTLGYDGSGNLTTDGTWTYGYDAENRLVYASDGNSITTYAYGPKGRRIIKDSSVTGETQYLYEGDEPIADYTGGGSLIRRYVHGAVVDERLVFWQYATTDGSLERQLSYIANHQGSIIGLIDLATAGDYTAGEVTRLTYDAYGVPGQASEGQPFRYTGRRYDPETQLYYYRARYYSATLGRFLQTDPIGYEDNMNMYGYTNNDPVNKSDPTGMFAKGDTIRRQSTAFLSRIQRMRIDVNNGGTGTTGGTGSSGGTSQPRQYAGAVSAATGNNSSSTATAGSGTKVGPQTVPGAKGINAVRGLLRKGGRANAFLSAMAAAMGEAPEEIDIYFHYTDEAGARGIQQSQRIMPNARGHVYITRYVMSASQAHQNLFLGLPSKSGHGNFMAIISTRKGFLNTRPDPSIPIGLIHDGAIRQSSNIMIIVGRNALPDQ